jgi:hypothetical protein
MWMAALSIDGVTLYLARAEAQRAADAAALTAARVISISGITGDPSNSTLSWQAICGGSTGTATQAAQAVAQQNPIAGVSLPSTSIKVTYSGGSGGGANTDCSDLGSAFGVNPVVTVQVQRTDLPTFFARIWGRTGSSVSATATAEAFNPSNSASVAGAMFPVQPRCVKPWIVPNWDPGDGSCTGTGAGGCPHFVNTTTGAINNGGVLPNGTGVIGESFFLLADCTGPGATCTLAGTPPPPPQANVKAGPPNIPPGQPNLEYVPGAAVNSSVAVAANSSAACDAVSDAASQYAQAIAGCDQTTVYACGGPALAAVDLSENPSGAAGDTANGAKCLINQGGGQDTLDAGEFPFQIRAHRGNPLVAAGAVANRDVITSSNSIVSLPIYDTANVISQAGPNNVTVVGFLQVFINAVDPNGNVNVTVLNVAGCSNDASKLALLGTSPVPVRLITQP